MILLELDGAEPMRVSAVPIALDYCHTRLAGPGRGLVDPGRFVSACAALGTEVHDDDGRIVVELPAV